MDLYPDIGQHIWIVKRKARQIFIREGEVIYTDTLTRQELVITLNGIMATLDECFTSYSFAKSSALRQAYEYKIPLIICQCTNLRIKLKHKYRPRRQNLTAGEWVPEKLWDEISPLLPPPNEKAKNPGYDNRVILGAYLCSYYTGTQIRNLPAGLAPPYNTIYMRKSFWKKMGIWPAINERLLRHVDELSKEDLVATGTKTGEAGTDNELEIAPYITKDFL